MKLNVSLYIPVYNGGSTIESVIKSVLKLNPYPNEIIVIDDGSTDNTVKILEKYKKYIIVVKNPNNMGLAYSRNIGFERSFKLSILTLTNTVNSEMYSLQNFNFANLLTSSKISLIIFMIIGKIELISVFLIFKKIIFRN